MRARLAAPLLAVALQPLADGVARAQDEPGLEPAAVTADADGAAPVDGDDAMALPPVPAVIVAQALGAGDEDDRDDDRMRGCRPPALPGGCDLRPAVVPQLEPVGDAQEQPDRAQHEFNYPRTRAGVGRGGAVAAAIAATTLALPPSRPPDLPPRRDRDDRSSAPASSDSSASDVPAADKETTALAPLATLDRPLPPDSDWDFARFDVAELRALLDETENEATRALIQNELESRGGGGPASATDWDAAYAALLREMAPALLRDKQVQDALASLRSVSLHSARRRFSDLGRARQQAREGYESAIDSFGQRRRKNAQIPDSEIADASIYVEARLQEYEQVRRASDAYALARLRERTTRNPLMLLPAWLSAYSARNAYIHRRHESAVQLEPQLERTFAAARDVLATQWVDHRHPEALPEAARNVMQTQLHLEVLYSVAANPPPPTLLPPPP